MNKFPWYIFIIFLFFCSCMNYSSFQTAKVLDKHEQSMTAAYSRIYNNNSESIDYLNNFLFMGRYGLGHKFDAGMGLTLTYPFSTALSGDIKYQLLREPFQFAVDLGMTYSGFIFMPKSSGMLIVHPMVIAGTEHFYFAYKYNFGKIFSDLLVGSESGGFSTIHLGLSLGRNIKLIPEFSWHMQESASPLLVPGLGICVNLPLTGFTK